MTLPSLSIPQLSLHFAPLSTNLADYTPLLIDLGGLLTCFVILFFIQRHQGTKIYQVVRFKFIWYLLVAPGTALHETSHALGCVLTHTKILAFVPFHPQQKPNGEIELGHVDSVEQGFFSRTIINIAPLLFVPPILAWFTYLLLGTLDINQLGHALTTTPLPKLGLWLILMVLGGRAPAPSTGDHFNRLSLLLLIVLALGLGLAVVSATSVAFVAAFLSTVLFIFGLTVMVQVGLYFLLTLL
jgi:hypothetical protein